VNRKTLLTSAAIALAVVAVMLTAWPVLSGESSADYVMRVVVIAEAAVLALVVALGLRLVLQERRADRRIADATHALEARLHQGFDALDQGILLIDERDRIVGWNAAYARLFPEMAKGLGVGMTREAMLRLASEIVERDLPGTDRETWVRERLRIARDIGRTFVTETPSGRLAEIREHIIGSGGRIVTYREVTVEHAARRALAVSEQRFRAFAETTADWFWELDADLRFVFLSESNQAITGMPPEALYGKRPHDHRPEGVRDADWTEHLAMLERHEAFRDFRFESVDAKGRRHHLSVSARPWIDERGVFRGYRGSGRDITVVVEAQQARGEALALAEHNEALLRDGLASMSDGVVLFDANDRVILWNSRYVAIFEHLQGVIRRGMTMREILRGHAESPSYGVPAEERELWVRNVLAANRLSPGGYKRSLVDGRILSIIGSRTGAGGEVHVVRDITDEIRSKEKITASLAREREMAAQQKRFVSVAAHEFRTPLTIIDGAAQRLIRYADQIKPKDVRERAQKIRAATARMSELVDATLNSARLDEGRIEVNRTQVNLVALVAGVAKRIEGIARDFQIRVEAEPPVVVVEADPSLLDQVFTNLLSNAVKYSGASRRIDVRIVAAEANAIVAVRDYGIGVPDTELPHLFTRFYRASTAKGLPGTGIGLNLVRELVQLHGGDVAVESRLGEGSTFRVTLPRGSTATQVKATADAAA
jgi:PAS domain S-box-containing protein